MCLGALLKAATGRIRGCARRLASRDVALTSGQSKEPLLQDCEAEMPLRGPGEPRILFTDLSDEVCSATFLFLAGHEAGAHGAAVCWRLRRVLEEPEVWRSFRKQDFAPDAPLAASYRELFTRQQCRQLEWRRLPVHPPLGGREGMPWSFSWRDHVFFFGGWEYGGYDFDLRGGPIAVPLRLQEIDIRGQAPPSSYCCSVTLLDDGRRDRLRVLVFGGYLFNGYSRESHGFGVFEVRIGEEGCIEAKWEKVGHLSRLSNHSATFIPPALAGATYPEGYVLVAGGLHDSREIASVGVLDLQTFSWNPSVGVHGGDTLTSRHSHTATLLRRKDGTHGVFLMGGATGKLEGENPTVSGQDLPSAGWIVGLEDADLRWVDRFRDNLVPGRGHVACRLPGTNTVLAVGGGSRPGSRQAVAFQEGRQPRAASQSMVRIMGGGCAFADGLLLVHGGFNSRRDTHPGDVWVAKVAGTTSDFFDKLPDRDEAAQEEEQRVEHGRWSFGFRTMPPEMQEYFVPTPMDLVRLQRLIALQRMQQQDSDDSELSGEGGAAEAPLERAFEEDDEDEEDGESESSS